MNIKLDEGFQFGLGAFETIAVENKNPVFLERFSCSRGSAG